MKWLMGDGILVVSKLHLSFREPRPTPLHVVNVYLNCVPILNIYFVDMFKVIALSLRTQSESSLEQKCCKV